MSYGPDYPAGIPQQTVFTRNVRSTIFELKSYIMRCPDSKSALNAWCLLCEFEYSICAKLAQLNQLPPDSDGMNWKEYINGLKTEFDELKTSEKTCIDLCRDGAREKYKIQWDNYVGEFSPPEFEKGVEIMDMEKYDAIRHGLMKIVGKFEFVLFAADELRMEDKLEIPLPLDVYTEEQSHQTIESRKGVPRQSEQTQPQRR